MAGVPVWDLQNALEQGFSDQTKVDKLRNSGTLGIVLALDSLLSLLVAEGGSDLHVKAFAAPPFARRHSASSH